MTYTIINLHSPDTPPETQFVLHFNALAAIIHAWATDKGFWPPGQDRTESPCPPETIEIQPGICLEMEPGHYAPVYLPII